jgi:PHD/YefM family antitoxin component YafN of YafNO toxin-antitoxin module
MRVINFTDIKKNIQKRHSEITVLRAQFAPLLIIDSENKAVIDPEEQKNANEIMVRINLLRSQNAADVTFRDSALTTLQQHNIKPHAEGMVDFDTLTGNLRNHINLETRTLKNKFIAGELTSAAYEEAVKSMSKPHEDRIAEIEAVGAELDKLAKGVAP